MRTDEHVLDIPQLVIRRQGLRREHVQRRSPKRPILEGGYQRFLVHHGTPSEVDEHLILLGRAERVRVDHPPRFHGRRRRAYDVVRDGHELLQAELPGAIHLVAHHIELGLVRVTTQCDDPHAVHACQLGGRAPDVTVAHDPHRLPPQLLDVEIVPHFSALLFQQPRHVLREVRARHHGVLGEAAAELSLGVGHDDPPLRHAGELVRFEKVDPRRPDVYPFQGGEFVQDERQLETRVGTAGGDEQHVRILAHEGIGKVVRRRSHVEETGSERELARRAIRERSVGVVAFVGQAEDASLPLDALGGHVEDVGRLPVFGFLAVPVFVLVQARIP
mmetsp:Transcript_14448/g.34836  ORF Transcript_14448/g.34836 Transcript_14448/m.34836 type:complete len:332 (+) Transcript_14448:623-1618(+)